MSSGRIIWSVRCCLLPPASQIAALRASSAWAFVYYMMEGSLRTIGILSREFNKQIDFAGNTSRAGCVLVLTEVTMTDNN